MTSCANEEGKTTAAINMAHGLSINKNRVLLVDGNPRAPGVAQTLHTTVPGLSSWLAGNGDRGGARAPHVLSQPEPITFGRRSGPPQLLAENACPGSWGICGASTTSSWTAIP